MAEVFKLHQLCDRDGLCRLLAELCVVAEPRRGLGGRTICARRRLVGQTAMVRRWQFELIVMRQTGSERLFADLLLGP